MKLDGYQTYCLFIALKNHFTQKRYDFFKYNGKTNVSKESFSSSRDKYKYIKLARKYDDSQMRDFIISNLLFYRLWIGDYLDEDADKLYKDYMKRKQAITYCFANELEKLGDLKKAFRVKNGQMPELINFYLQGQISIETMTILNQFIQYASKFDKVLGADCIIWGRIRLLILKLTPFLEYDKEKIKDILKQNINNSVIKKEKELEKT